MEDNVKNKKTDLIKNNIPRRYNTRYSIAKAKNQIKSSKLKNNDDEISKNCKKHKKSKYQTPVNSNSCVSHRSMTLENNMVLNTSDDAGTNADTSSNKDKSLNVLNGNCTISITAKDDINSMDIANNDTSTSASAYNNTNSGINNYTVECKTCNQDFNSMSDFENHLVYETDEISKICKHHDDMVRQIMECVPKDYYVSATNNGLPNQQYLSKDAWKPDENHMKALDKVCVVEQEFYCEFCEAVCEQADHYQLNQWCSFNEHFKCYVCELEFFNKERLQLHENEHVKLHIC